MARPSLHQARVPQTVVAQALPRGISYGLLAGCLSGTVYGTIVFPLVGTVVGAVVGSVAGVIAGMLGGLTFACVTWLLFLPLLNPARYRITIALLSITLNPIVILTVLLLVQAPQRWYDDRLLIFVFLPALISEGAALIVGQILAHWYVTNVGCDGGGGGGHRWAHFWQTSPAVGRLSHSLFGGLAILTIGAVGYTAYQNRHTLLPITARFVTISPDGSRLAVAQNGHIELWDIPQARIAQHFSDNQDTNTRVAWSPDGTRIATADDNGLHLWNAASGAHISNSHKSNDFITVAWSPDGSLIAGAGPGGVHVWRAADQQIVRTFKTSTPLDAVVLTNDNRVIAYDDTQLFVWSNRDGRLLIQRQLPDDGYFQPVAISPDGMLLATFGKSQRLTIWRIADGTYLRELQGNPYPIDTLAFSPDSQWLATAGGPERYGYKAREPGIIQVWAVADGRLAKALKGPQGTTLALVFSANGQRLASVNNDDHTVRIWPVP